MPATILVVDDEKDFTQLVAFHLRRNGYEALRAHDGEEALDQARRHLPDLILLDLRLPQIDGFTVCELLRRHPPTHSIPILLITALPGQLARYNGLACGADEYLSKPISPAELIRRIERALRSPRAAAPGRS